MNEEEKLRKIEEMKKKREEENKKMFNEYIETRIDIKNNFLPKSNDENNTYYDVIVKMNSLRELLLDGWEIYCSNQYENYKNNPYCIPISILGEGNSGKSFLLKRIFNVNIPNGFSQKTEGISVKYLENFNFALIDTSGLRKSINKDYKNLLKKLIQKENKKTEININEIKNKDENLFYRCFNKINSDIQFIEEFIVDFALKKSNIILIVVGQMTINEQLFINKIINELTNQNFDDKKEIIVIHNLYNFIKKSQVENYVNEVLKKSIYFNLEEVEFDFNVEIQNEISNDFNKKFFIDKFTFLDKEITIIHLIFANDSKESDAGNYYNYSTIHLVKNEIGKLSNFKTFDVIEELKNFLIEKSYNYFKDENNSLSSPINESNLRITNNINEINESKKKMKIIENSNLKMLSDIEEQKNKIKYSKNVFIPPYSYYKEFVKKSFLYKNYKGNEKIEILVIAIELAGIIIGLKSSIKISKNGNYNVLITGIKELKKNNDISCYESNIEENEFKIEFEIDINEIELKSTKLIKSSMKNGIIKLYYEIKPKIKDDEKIEIKIKKK